MKKNEKEPSIAPTAEMQLGEVDLKQLVVDADLGGRATVGLHGRVMLGSAWLG